MLKNMAFALVLTLLLEWAFALIWGIKEKEDLKLITLANILTNPAVNLLYALLVRLWGLPTVAVILILELCAVAVEWLCYRPLANFHYPLLFSLCANAFSVCAGHLLQFLF